MTCESHDFGHHPDSCDPWDALVSDLTALGECTALALATFWRGEARKPMRPIAYTSVTADDWVMADTEDKP